MNSYFEGWYFKQQTGRETIAFIPAIHIDSDGHKSASIQVITDEASYCAAFPYSQFHADRNRLIIEIGDNLFSRDGIIVNLKTENMTASGKLRYGAFSPLKNDIMGPFRFVPAMECRHSVISMAHRVDGYIAVNGASLVFNDGTGYIEGDRGHSFPKKYIWTHCSFRGGALMLSVADIPLYGLNFTGIIGALLLNGREYRIATYRGAKALETGNGKAVVRQGGYVLSAELVCRRETPLRAPVMGSMKRLIKESPSCAAIYKFEKNGETLLDLRSDMASFEYEY